MIPFGPWHPDKAGVNIKAVNSAINVLPDVNGFRPLPSLQEGTGQVGANFLTDADGALIIDVIGTHITAEDGGTTDSYLVESDGDNITDAAGDYLTVEGSPTASTCQGAAVVFDDDGDVYSFSGDETSLYQLDLVGEWQDVSRLSGGDYSAGSGERWQFGFAGGLVVAVTIGDVPQKFLLGTSTNFEALGGTPPQARYVATVRDFVVLGGLFGDERTIHWSGLANAEHWTPGTQSCDTQTFQNGGPVRGIVGGETGYVFQADKIQRMTYAPGSAEIFQFDEVEGGRGLAAPYSLVKLGNDAYYLASDGFYKFSLTGGGSTPLGVGKWAKWFISDIKPGTESIVIGGADPVKKILVWAYNSLDNVTSTLNRCLIYDWSIDEAATADITITTLAQIITQGITVDTMDSYGTLDELPFSLDSPAWRGGASLLGVFGTDNAMSFFNGSNMEATFETNDGQAQQRMLIKGVRPHIDTRSVSIELAPREAEGDTVAFLSSESMADTGEVPLWGSGFLARARLTVAEGASWSKITGMTPKAAPMGQR
jgi:hypothetical protein